jgi:hypothetical protein
MSPKSIAILVALAALSSLAVVATIAPWGFRESRIYFDKADLDEAFASVAAAFIQHPEILNPAITAPDRESLRLALTKQMTLERASEYAVE